jgi:hypothetical protein
MKLDLTSLSFNSILQDGVGTPSWGTALGQGEGYNITVNGANDLLLGMFNNRIDEAALEHNLRGEKDVLIAACFKCVYINGLKISEPLILAIVEEHSQSHDGRKSLKYNDKFKYALGQHVVTNEAFYQAAQMTLGDKACWFGYEFRILNGTDLDIRVIVVGDKPITYANSKERKDEWNKLIEISSIGDVKFNESNVKEFADPYIKAGLILSPELIQRFIASMCTKPFVILTGLTGSGKTKLAQAFSMWISESKEQYAIVPVGADWTNREPLLGYPNSLVAHHYVNPDSGVLDILLRAHSDFQANNEELAKCKPYFLILDEMNLSHVERYFADFLSTIESGDAIKLYSGSDRYAELDNDQTPITSSLLPRSVKWPKNLFIIGTVNIDETTYMFSPKVLDRANTIEFRISSDEMEKYFVKGAKVNMDLLLEDVDSKRGSGASWAADFMSLAAREGIVVDHEIHQETFVRFFIELQKAGAEFGYRTANEMTELMVFLAHFNVKTDEAYDIAIMQKLLPKLHGSRSKLNKVIPPLLALCENDGKVIYPLSHEKLNRMKKNADENGFASYAEA